jgi:type VI secretion system protein ImpL
MKALSGDSRLLIILLIAIVLFALVLVGAAIVLLMRARAADRKEEPEQEGPRSQFRGNERTPGLVSNFREAMGRLRDRLSTWNARYDVPWYVLAGEAGSGKTTVADTLRGGSVQTIQNAENLEGTEFAPRWLLLEQAVLIDLPGAAFLDGSATDVQAGKRTAHADRVAWRNFLRLCARYRPRQPLNGIVLTLPATELLAAVQEPGRPERMARIVELARRLDDIQRFTALKLPIYVLVTKCDAVSGFQSYSRIFFERAELSPGAGEQGDIEANLFGWSNPYLLDTSFSPSWIDDAFEAINDRLLRYQLEMLAGSRTTAEANDVMLFPFALQDLRDPLRAALDRIFRVTAYHGPHTLRGIYFSGRESETDAIAAEPSTALKFSAPLALLRPAADRVIYLRHLFEFKVFAERFLASPVARGYFTRNRSVIAARIAACLLLILFSASTFAAWVRLSALAHDQVQPTLEQLARELDQIAVAPGSNLAPAATMISHAGESHVDELYSPAMPYSYIDLSGLHRQLHQVLENSFAIVVLRSCHDALESRIYGLLGATPARPAAAYSGSAFAPGTAWSADPAYRDLANYLTSIETLIANIDRYRFISGAGSGSVAQLNQLMRYLGAYDLPDSSRFERDPNYRRLLLNAVWSPLVLPEQFDQKLAASVTTRVQNFYDSWFGVQTNPLATEVTWLRGADGLPLLFSAQSEPTNDQLRAIVNRIQSMDSQLTGGSYDWLASDFQRENYPALGSALDRMPFADSQFTGQIIASGLSYLAALQNAVLSGTPQIVLTSNGQVRMADDVRTLGSVLDALLNYQVMNEVSPGAVASSSCQAIPAGYVWNQTDLQTALKLFSMRQKIDAELIPEVPGLYRQAVATLVDGRTAANISLVLANAASPNANATDAQSGMETELKNLSQSLGLLGQAEEDLLALHDTSARRCLERSLINQSNALLAQINSQLPTMFSPAVATAKGNLNTPVSLALYGFNSSDDLQQYLSTEQQKVQAYAAEAAPLVNLLESHGSHSALLSRWDDISHDIAALGASKVNPIQTLELYISTDLDQVTPDADCKTVSQGNSSDVFLNVRSELARLAVDECHNIAVQRFNAIAAAFNKTLAGRFPFSQTLDNRPAAQASPEEIASFYRTLDLYGNGLEKVLPGLVKDPDAATGFLEAVRQARPLVTGTPSGTLPSLTVLVHFRANLSGETYGGSIGAWTIRIGQKTVSYPPGQVTGPGLAWHPGDPVSVVLRYAFDSPEIPSGVNASAAAQTSGNTVTFQYNGPWALYAMLRDHTVTPNDGSGDYVFLIPNKYSHGANAASNPPDTVVFLGVHLLPFGAQPGGESLSFPVFPYNAPAAQLAAGTGE